MKPREKSSGIRRYILENVQEHPSDIASFAAGRFSISRQAINRHIKALVDDGLLLAKGKTRSIRYSLKSLTKEQITIELSAGISEDKVWRKYVQPLLSALPENVLSICNYGVAEMMNNAIEHSNGSVAVINVWLDAVTVSLEILDNGIGIFKKITMDMNLEDERHAILELSKGKLTTDPQRHTGEGIFFTSRMFDRFYIQSGRSMFSHFEPEDSWSAETKDAEFGGTLVHMSISTSSERSVERVFDNYVLDNDTYAFARTQFPLVLARYGEENLFSRSQARRILARIENFEEVVLDFKGIRTIGQGFADEIFRVFQTVHPGIEIGYTNATDSVKRMISRAQAARKQLSS